MLRDGAARHGTARHGIAEFSAAHHLHQQVTVYLDECEEGDRLQSVSDRDNDSCQAQYANKTTDSLLAAEIVILKSIKK